jgi:hypothetical protein
MLENSGHLSFSRSIGGEGYSEVPRPKHLRPCLSEAALPLELFCWLFEDANPGASIKAFLVL